MTAGSTPSAVSSALSNELENFAEGALRRELAQFSARLREELRQDLQQLVQSRTLLARGVSAGTSRIERQESGGQPAEAGMDSTLASSAKRPARPPPLLPLTPGGVKVVSPFGQMDEAGFVSPSMHRYQEAMETTSHEWALRHPRGFRSAVWNRTSGEHKVSPNQLMLPPSPQPQLQGTPSKATPVSISTSENNLDNLVKETTLLVGPKGMTGNSTASIVELQFGTNGAEGKEADGADGAATPAASTPAGAAATVRPMSSSGQSAASKAPSSVQAGRLRLEELTPVEAWSPVHERGPLINTATSRMTASDHWVQPTQGSFDPEDPDQPACCRCLARIVRHPLFDMIVGFLVLLNTVIIGMQVDHVARTRVKEVPEWLRVLEIFFCAAFALEITLRLCVHRCRFFLMGSRYWNIFDCAMVGLQIAEEVLWAVADVRESLRINFTFMRCLRILRVIRVLRVVIIFRMVGELRTLIASIKHSLSSLGWTVVLLALVIYVSSVWCTHIVTDYEMQNPDHHEYSAALQAYYGSLGRTALSLYESVTGGLDWEDAVTPLMKTVSPVLAPLFAMYIAFVVFAVLNIVTGVFVQSAMANSREDTDMAMKQNITELFEKDEQGETRRSLTLHDFEKHMDKPQMHAYFEAIDVDPSEARGVFKLLDLDNSGYIDREDFLSGCLRLRGPAKALDLALLMHEVRCLAIVFRDHRYAVEEFLTAGVVEGSADNVEVEDV